MAEIYPLGENRIFYRTNSKEQPDEVRADLLDPDLNNHVHLPLKKVVDVDGNVIPKLYYFNPFFSTEGTYIAIFCERIEEGEWIEKATQAFSTRRLPTISEGGGFRSSPGDNVING